LDGFVFKKHQSKGRFEMKKINQMIVGTVFAFSLVGPSQQAHAVIPTTDSLSITQIIALGVTLVDQLVMLGNQYDLAKVQYDEMRGISNIGKSISDQLETNRDQLFALKAPSDVFKDPLFTVDQLFSKEGKAKESYIKRSEFIQSNVTKVNGMYESLLARKSTLNSLKNQIGSANTNKQILDLTARISAENGLLQNDIALISMLKISMDLSDQAMNFEEAGRRIANLKEASDVK
jgi:hypothetical protein